VFSLEGARAQSANQITWRLLGDLKNIRKMYLNICVLLAKVRDERLYASLHFPDMETYARERLNLGKSSLYNYLMIHDWAAKKHPDWLDPKTKGPKLDFSDVGDLIWIEKELSQPDITESKKAKLQDLQQKAMEGTLKSTEVRELKKPAKTVQNSLKSLVSAIRGVRNRAKKLANCPPEAIEHLDAAVEVLSNDDALKVAGIDVLSCCRQKWPQISVA
jgi:hypothetical protein